ncbi:MAG TPA: phage holin family protein [Casimicrobiaceae bacterium]|nr:phage holin family protein [Casimicrobiaceae bacterium]
MEPSTPARGLKAAVARLADSFIALARTRTELAGLELGEERDRLIARLALVLGGVLMLAFATLAVSALIVALAWSTHPIAALVAVATAYVVAGLVLLAKAREVARKSSPPFAATLAELTKDRDRLKRAAREIAGSDP